MKLLDLHPEHGRVPTVPGRFWLLFDCPRCGPPRQVYVQIHQAEPTPGVWQIKSALPHLDFFGPYPDFAGLSLLPSIGEPPHGRERCSWHGTITNGEVSGNHSP